jgi:probable F420-dependent oxidoreductase
VKFGFPRFAVSPRRYAEVAQLVEAHGFESIWIPEHLVFPAKMPASYPYTSDGQPGVDPSTPLFDPWVALAYIAAGTERLRLGTQVFVLPLRHPIAVARTVVTLDRLSGGRVILGAGVGWLEEEFAAVGQSFHTRGRRTDEMIDVIRRLFREQAIEHHGEFFDFEAVRFEPKPLEPGGIPIEIGAASRTALERAGRLGDGWIEIGCRNFDELAERLGMVTAARTKAGRDQLPFEVSTGSTIVRGLDEIRRAEALGVTRVIIGPDPGDGPLTIPVIEAWLDRFARDVIQNLG